MSISSKYVIGIHIDKEPRVRCKKYYTPKELGIHKRLKRFTILGEECVFEKWVKSFYDGIAIELPMRVPHYAPETFVECVEGKRNCGRTVETYRVRPLAKLVGAKKAVLLIYGSAAWSNDRYALSYANFVVKNLGELLFVF